MPHQNLVKYCHHIFCVDRPITEYMSSYILQGGFRDLVFAEISSVWTSLFSVSILDIAVYPHVCMCTEIWSIVLPLDLMGGAHSLLCMKL